MKLPVVDQEICIGCGTCVVIAEKTFKLNKESKAEVIRQSADDEKTIQEAIDACPVTCITWREE